MTLPRTIGPYRIHRSLGHGGMAQVFEASVYGASGFEKRVAIKILLPELRGSGELERLLIEEARLGARMSHRNLVQVHDLGVDRGVYYVRMDYIDGTDLATLTKSQRLPIPITLLIAEEVALALEYVHSVTDDEQRPLGLVHRDISPSNVLISRWGEVKLSDFGITKATMLVETTRASIRRGKYAYMSPEQIGGKPLSAQSDQFGFGVMLYELLTGGRPYDGETPMATMDRIREAKEPNVGEIPKALGKIVLRCLQKAPEERFEKAADLRKALSEARRQRRGWGLKSREMASSPELGQLVAASLESVADERPPRPETRPLTKTE